jgi:hypothetical protein
MSSTDFSPAAPDVNQPERVPSTEKARATSHWSPVAIDPDLVSNAARLASRPPLHQHPPGLEPPQSVGVFSCGRDLAAAYHTMDAPDDEGHGGRERHLFMLIGRRRFVGTKPTDARELRRGRSRARWCVVADSPVLAITHHRGIVPRTGLVVGTEGRPLTIGVRVDGRHHTEREDREERNCGGVAVAADRRRGQICLRRVQCVKLH